MTPRFGRLCGLAGLAAAALGLILPAHASEDTSGRWTFRTAIEAKGCTISGDMTIDATRQPDGSRACQFVSSETCGALDANPAFIEQSCRVVDQGDFLLIRSRVQRSLSPDVPAARYLPDHFTVRPTAPGEMRGIWYDRNYRDSVVFKRPEARPSS